MKEATKGAVAENREHAAAVAVAAEDGLRQLEKMLVRLAGAAGLKADFSEEEGKTKGGALQRSVAVARSAQRLRNGLAKQLGIEDSKENRAVALKESSFELGVARSAMELLTDVKMLLLTHPTLAAQLEKELEKG